MTDIADNNDNADNATAPPENQFQQLHLNAEILKALEDVGYETPTPIQLRTIPILMSGQDLIGQAQTGTGKTAAFAIPLLQRINISQLSVQALVLAPTRELAIQVSDAIHTYAKYMGRVRVLPIYGGQPIHRQIERLQNGLHIVVGTPGRVMDHLRRGTLKFDHLKIVVLDEADEMLRMGFIDDVDWILSQATGELQKALFSATMPTEVRRIADRYLQNPARIDIEHKALTVPTVVQRYINVSEQQKLDTLTRILESEEGASVLIFTHTKLNTAELADKLQTRGFAAEAMHGDMTQAQREIVIRRLRTRQSEVVVATDVAARGLDIDHITHVINYDIPYDPESYVHRIGRTARAGREGTSITLVTPRQNRLLRDIERFIGQKIEAMRVPSKADMAARRVALFKESIRKTLAEEDLEFYLSLVEDLAAEGYEIAEIAAATARLARGDKPLEAIKEAANAAPEVDPHSMVQFFMDIGHIHNLRPSDVVGAIANEADVPGNAIGHIDIYERYTIVDIPGQYREQVLQRMKRTKIRRRPINIKIAKTETYDNSFEKSTPQPKLDRPQYPIAKKLPQVELKPTIEAKVEPKVEPKIEPKVESKVESRVERKVEPKVERRVEPAVEQKIEAKVERKVERKAERTIERTIERKAEANVAPRMAPKTKAASQLPAEDAPFKRLPRPASKAAPLAVPSDLEDDDFPPFPRPAHKLPKEPTRISQELGRGKASRAAGAASGTSEKKGHRKGESANPRKKVAPVASGNPFIRASRSKASAAPPKRSKKR